MVLSRLSLEQKLSICNEFKQPFNGFKDNNYYNNIKEIVLEQLDDVEVYDFEQYKEHLIKKFKSSLIEPRLPLGVIASDAIAQQSMQSVLDSFHSVGSAVTRGPSYLREIIGILPNRENLYTRIGFNNPYLTYTDVMKLCHQFISISISFLLKENPYTYNINIHEIVSYRNKEINKSLIDELNNKKLPWWYIYHDGIGQIYDYSNQKSYNRTCIRLKFDVQKLYEYQITLSDISAFLRTFIFKIALPKDSTTSKNRTYLETSCIIINSPTDIGIIDVFYKNTSRENDFYLNCLLHGNDFNNMYYSGFNNIKNFFAISTNITRFLSCLSKTTEDDNNNGNYGTWLYINNNRFTTLPLCRIIKLIKESGLSFDFPSYGKPLSFNYNGEDIIYTDINFEYHSHKLIKELRNKLKIRAFLLNNYRIEDNMSYTMNNQRYYYINNHYTSKKINEGNQHIVTFIKKDIQKFNVYLYKDEIETDIKKIIKKINKNITKDNNYIYKLINDKFIDENGIKIDTNLTFYLCFKSNEYYYYCRVDLYKYEDYEIDVNLDYCNSHLITQSLNSVLSQNFNISVKYFNINSIQFDTNISNYIILEESKVDNPINRILLKTYKFKEVSELVSFFNKNVNKKYLEYVYAETVGSDLVNFLCNKNINKCVTFCNDFYQTYNLLDIEGLRNLLVYDMIEMINSSGYINVSYINLESDLKTHNRPNPLTSNGIKSHKRGINDMITFDNAGSFIVNGVFKSKLEYCLNPSTSILIGNKINLCTTSTTFKLNNEDILFNKTENDDKEFIFNDTLKINDNQKIKFPIVNFIFDKFINKNVNFYIKNGIELSKCYTFSLFDIRVYNRNEHLKYNKLYIQIK
jgi:hypothetical protein